MPLPLMTYSLIALRCSSNEFSDSHNKNKLKGLPMVRVDLNVLGVPAIAQQTPAGVFYLSVSL